MTTLVRSFVVAALVVFGVASAGCAADSAPGPASGDPAAEIEAAPLDNGDEADESTGQVSSAMKPSCDTVVTMCCRNKGETTCHTCYVCI